MPEPIQNLHQTNQGNDAGYRKRGAGAVSVLQRFPKEPNTQKALRQMSENPWWVFEVGGNIIVLIHYGGCAVQAGWRIRFNSQKQFEGVEPIGPEDEDMPADVPVQAGSEVGMDGFVHSSKAPPKVKSDDQPDPSAEINLM